MNKVLENKLDTFQLQLAAVRLQYDELAPRASENKELIPEVRRNLARQIDLNGWLGHYYELADLYWKYGTWCMDQGDAEAAHRAHGTIIEDVIDSYRERRCLQGFEDWQPLYD